MSERKPDWIDKVLAADRQEYGQLQQKPAFDIGDAYEILLPMTDGIRLRTVCQRPVGEGPFPTVIQRSCYPFQEDMMRQHAEQYCRRGFAFVWQFCRGTGGSEGEWVPNIHDRQDGKETLDWLDAQPWVDEIGFWGSSYLAFTGWIVADILPAKVRTLYLTHYGTDRFTSAYQNGLFRQDVLTSWAMGNAGRKISADYHASLKFRPQVEVDERLWGVRLDWYRDWITNTSRQDPYWNSGFWRELQEIPGKMRVPVFIGEGWYDHHLGSALKSWQALSEESRRHSRLRIGAWNHSFRPCLEGVTAEHLENSDVISAFNWFDQLLRRKEMPETDVQVYEIGSDRWLDLAAYPFEDTGSRTLYLNAKGSGQTGSLTESAPAEPGEVSYIYNPDDPVPSHGAESLLATMRENGSLLQPGCNWRSDVVSFVSEPLTAPIAILGRLKVILQVASTANDTAFTAKIMEVRPDGSAYNIRSGITTLGYRAGSDSARQVYQPGETVEAIIDFWDISFHVGAGSHIRIDISSSDFPQYAVHSNHAGVWSLQNEVRTAVQTVRTGAGWPSRLVIPVRNPG